MAVVTLLVAALPVATALGFVFGVEPEVKQRVVVWTCHHGDVAATPAIAAAGSAARNELLTPERKDAVAAVAGLHGNYDFIDEHSFIEGTGDRGQGIGMKLCQRREARADRPVLCLYPLALNLIPPDEC